MTMEFQSLSNLQILQILTENSEIFYKMFLGDNVRLMYVNVWNRIEIFRKLKISQGVKPVYHNGISKSTKFADIVNFHKKTVKYFTKCVCVTC